MDIANVKAENRTIEIMHPDTEEPVGIRITIRSEYHPSVKAAQRRNLDGQLNSKKAKMTAKQLERNNEALNVACVESWEWYGEGVNYKGDENPPCDADTVEAVFKDAPWIKDQVRKEFDDTAAFFRA